MSESVVAVGAGAHYYDQFNGRNGGGPKLTLRWKQEPAIGKGFGPYAELDAFQRDNEDGPATSRVYGGGATVGVVAPVEGKTGVSFYAGLRVAFAFGDLSTPMGQTDLTQNDYGFRLGISKAFGPFEVKGDFGADAIFNLSTHELADQPATMTGGPTASLTANYVF